MASGWQNKLAVVFLDHLVDLFYDRPIARQSRADEVLCGRISWHVGKRLFGARTTPWFAHSVNSHAERSIRPAVIIRKNSYGNRSERGADAQAVLMSIFRTLKQRGHDPVKTITQAIHTYLQTGQLPPLPSQQHAAK